MLLGLAGCFAPSVPAGVPCDPQASACPSGQRCVAAVEGYVCSTGDGLSEVDAAPVVIDAAIDAAIDAPPAVPVQKTYLASVAECINPAVPSTDLCRAVNGNLQMVIDLKDSTTNNPWSAFMRFELDGAIAGKTVTKVVLRLRTTADPKAPGPDTGSIFKVQPFTLASLSMTTPEKVGGQLAGTQGSVGVNTTVDWTLPVATVTANGTVYLGLFGNVDDGVNYWNLDGMTPPRLIVDAQ